MDCEKFEAAMMDELYGELDELTSAAAKRHVAGCSRCAALLGGLRATKRLAAVPLLDVPVGLEARVLGAAAEAQKVTPIRRRFARVVTVAGTWAMRPQSAMSAVFMVMLGTSLLLLRGRSSRAPASAEVTVTQHGTPAPVGPPAAAPAADNQSPGVASFAVAAGRIPEPKPASAPPSSPGVAPQGGDQPLDDLRAAKASGRSLARDEEALPPGPAGGFAAPPPMAPVAGGAGGAALQPGAASPARASRESADEASSPFDAALRLYQSGRYDEAARAFELLAAQDTNADLYAARSVREGKGCRPAVARFDRVAQRATGTPPGWDALLEGALCYRSLGDFGNARVRLTPLLSVDSHRDRARTEIDRLGQAQGAGNAAAAPASKASPKQRPAAAAAGAPSDVGGQ